MGLTPKIRFYLLVAADINRRGATATTQLPLATLNYSSLLLTTPRYPFCHVERSVAQSKHFSIVGYYLGTLRFLGIMGTACGLCGVCGLRGYTKNPHITHITHLT